MDESVYNQFFEALDKIVNDDLNYVEKLNRLKAAMDYRKPLDGTLLSDNQINFLELVDWFDLEGDL